MKKRIHDITFDPSQQPGYTQRYTSIQGFMGPALTEEIDASSDDITVRDDWNDREKFKSNQHPKTKPVTILRKKGYQTF